MHLAHDTNLAFLKNAYGNFFVLFGQSVDLLLHCILLIGHPEVLINNLQWHKACLSTLAADRKARPGGVAAVNYGELFVVEVLATECPNGVLIEVMCCLQCS